MHEAPHQWPPNSPANLFEMIQHIEHAQPGALQVLEDSLLSLHAILLMLQSSTDDGEFTLKDEYILAAVNNCERIAFHSRKLLSSFEQGHGVAP